jgi:pimeloyl-ACP methyl ester carboxylesterase
MTTNARPVSFANAEAALDPFFRPRCPPPDQNEARVLAEGRHRIVASLAVNEWGAGDAVLLLHGWSGHGGQFASFIGPLTGAGFQVIAIDSPAHGRSPGTTTHVGEMATAISRTVEELGPIRHVIAHSLGCVLATQAIVSGRIRPERAAFLAALSNVRGSLLRFAGAVGLPDPERDRFASLVEERVGRPADDLHIDRAANGITTRLLLVHDPQDHEVPFEDSRAIAEHWRASQLVPITGAGHRRILKLPQVIDQVVRFLTETVERDAATDAIRRS